MQRDAVEDLDLDAPTNDQPFDQIEAIQLGTPVGEWRQVPTRTRWWTTDSPTAIQGAASLQDQADGANAGWIGQATGEPLAVDSGGPELTEVAGVTQLLANGQYEVLPRALGAIDRCRQAARAVGPVDAIQALSGGALDPALHSGQGHAELLGDLTQGGSVSDGVDQGTSALLGRGFLLRADSSAEGF